MRGIVVAVLVGLVCVGGARADEQPVKLLTPEEAADAVLEAIQAKDTGALKALAENDSPDPWRVADELIRRGQHVAARSFARAAPRVDTKALPAYIASRRGKRDDPARRTRLAAANAALRERKFAEALDKIGPPARGKIVDVVGIRLAMVGGLALAGLGRWREAHDVHLALADPAKRIGWLARTARLLDEAATAAYRGADYPAALREWERLRILCDRRRDRRAAAAALGKLGLAHFELGEHAKAFSAYERALAEKEAVGDKLEAAKTRVNLANVHSARGEYRRALPLYERALAALQALGDKAGAATALGNIGGVWHSLGDHAKALPIYERALAEHEALGDGMGAARTLGNIGSVYFSSGDHARALEMYERAYAARMALGDKAGAARTLIDVGNAHHTLGDLAKALSCHERALSVLETIGDRVRVAKALHYLGKDHFALGDRPKALDFYQRALAAQEDRGDRAGVARVLDSIGITYRALGDAATALSYYERSLAAKEALGDKKGAALTLGNIGAAYQGLGDYARALSFLERAFETKQELGDKAGATLTLANIGNARTALGDYAKALPIYQRALAAMVSLGDVEKAAVTLGSIGSVQRYLGRYAEALVSHRRALEKKEALGDRAGAAFTLGNIGSVQYDLGDYAAALETLGRALAIQQALGDELRAAVTLGNIGSVHAALGDPATALSFQERGLATKAALGDTVGLPFALGRIAMTFHALGDHAKALAHARRAVLLRSSLITGLGAEEGAGAREALAFAYDVGARAALASEEAAELCFFLESGRGGALLEGLKARETLWEAAVPPALRSEEAKARTAEASAARALRQASDAGDLATMRARRADLAAAQERVSAVIARIQREAKAGAAIVYPAAATLREIQETLARGDTMVLYGVLETEACALVLTKAEARIVSLGESARIREAVEALAADEAASDPAAALERLKSLVVEPLRLPQTTARILVSPDGVLGYVPFAALTPKATVSYVSSGTTYLLLQEDRARSGRGVLALGDPDYASKVDEHALAIVRGGLRLMPLPATRKEVKAIGTHVLLGREATESEFASAVVKRKRWRAVHFACHGLVDPGRPALSSLALTPAGDDDGFLTCLDVFRMKIPSDLVVLSACETAKGKVVKTEGIVGMTRAFMFAGSPRVICSLWKVDDKATQALMIKFYDLWNPKVGAGLPTAEALRQAQEFIRHHPDHPEWKHPYYWAAWVLWGLPD